MDTCCFIFCAAVFAHGSPAREITRCPAAYRIHRLLTSPPSLQPGRELRKYHCLLCLSSPLPAANRLSSPKLDRSLLRSSRVCKNSLRTPRPKAQGMYLMSVYSVFKVHFQGQPPFTHQLKVFDPKKNLENRKLFRHKKTPAGEHPASGKNNFSDYVFFTRQTASLRFVVKAFVVKLS
jgi:hypothetical protein